jgi:hypothetical protein
VAEVCNLILSCTSLQDFESITKVSERKASLLPGRRMQSHLDIVSKATSHDHVREHECFALQR